MIGKSLLGLRPCTWVWLLMLGLTLVTFLIGEAGMSGVQVSLTVLALALLKGQLLGDFFMGLKGLRGFWRWPVSLWLILPGGVIAAAFMAAG